MAGGARIWWLAALLAAALLLYGWWLMLLLRKAESPVLARVWRPSAPGFDFPELTESEALRDYLLDRQDFGIAVAGGGTRGMAMGHGALRVLRRAGAVGRARYLSMTSGSLWLGLPLYYRQDGSSLDQFFGENMPPGSLTPERLTRGKVGSFLDRLTFFSPNAPEVEDEPNGTSENAADMSAMLRTAMGHLPEDLVRSPHGNGWMQPLFTCLQSNDICTCMVKLGLPDTCLTELWNFLQGFIFLAPFGLAQPFSSHCHETQLERTRARLGPSAKIHVARDMSQGLPFLLTQSAILAPLTGRDEHHTVAAFPLEHTPLYTGTFDSYTGNRSYPYDAVGDILVEPFVWPGVALQAILPASTSEVLIKHSMHLVNLGQLSEWAGIATNYIADYQARPWTARLPVCLVEAVQNFLPHVPLWSPLGPYNDEGAPANQDIAVGDAGTYDDLGHIPLLRRRVSKILLFDSSAIHDNSTGREKENLCEMVYTYAAFGQSECLNAASPPGSSNPMMAAGFNTVFEPSEFPAFIARVKQLHAARRPVVIRGNFTVVDNSFLGIKGGWKAEIIWVIGLPVPSWRAALPPKTRRKLHRWLPNYFASDIHSKLELAALSQFSSWVTENFVLNEVRAMLDLQEPAAQGGPSHMVTL